MAGFEDAKWMAKMLRQVGRRYCGANKLLGYHVRECRVLRHLLPIMN